MAISAAKRKSLPKKDFGLPSKAKGKEKGESGNYPVDTPGRARAAKAYASKEEKAGKLTKGQEEQIDRRANKRLGKKSK